METELTLEYWSCISFGDNLLYGFLFQLLLIFPVSLENVIDVFKVMMEDLDDQRSGTSEYFDSCI